MSQATERPSFDLDSVPMAYDRSEGWAAFRAAGEVFEADGAWYLTSVEAVRVAHQNPLIFSSALAYDGLGSPLPLVPLAKDPPDHIRYRRVLDPMLAPRVINRIDEELRRQVGVLIDAFADRGSCDVVTDLARLYPTQVFLTLFGLPLEDRDRFIDWAEAIIEAASINSDEIRPEVMQLALELFGYLQQCLEDKRRSPGDDMLSRVIALSGDDAWSEDDILGLCFLFTLAGLDTVTATIGFTLLHLARRPDLRRRIVEDPALADPVIEEILRLELPAPLTPRVTTAEVEVCGVTIPAGARVMVAIGAADRDPILFEQPDQIDADATRGHFAFGGGIHRCLGSHLARRELRLVVQEFLKRIPDYEIAPGIRPRVVWPSGTLHLESLPLTFPTSRA